MSGPDDVPFVTHLEARVASQAHPVSGFPGDDGILVADRVVAVADGLDDRRASGSKALAELARLLGPVPARQSLEGVLRAVNVALWLSPDCSGELRSTLTVAVWLGAHLTVGHIGDARAYLVRTGVIHRLTADHSGQEGSSLDPVVRIGGGPHLASPQVKRFRLRGDDRLVLCTDGLWRALPPNALASIGDLEPENACHSLFSVASECTDDASVVVVAFSEFA